MSALYTPEMLALSTELSRHPWFENAHFQAEKRSTVCGSTLAIAIDTNADGAITRLGLKVSACAVGQSSAALFARAAKGSNLGRIDSTLNQLRRWLSGEGDLPDWPGLEAIAGALPHKGRHGALVLPWETAVEALSSAQ